LAFRCPHDQRREAYLRAPAGAIGLLRALARGEAGDWPYLAGVSGTGKTHLALVGRAAEGQRQLRRPGPPRRRSVRAGRRTAHRCAAGASFAAAPAVRSGSASR
jgi:hypothetical protein